MNLRELLLELRRNPTQNKKVAGHQQAANFIKAHWKNPAVEEYGVSMTDIPKLGINPGSAYNTPLGIYFYPASYYLEMKYNKNELLEFQDDAPYIQILKFNTDNILEIDTLDVDGYQEYIGRLIKNVNRVASLIGQSEKVTLNTIVKASTDAKSNAKVNSYGGEFWYLLWTLSNVDSQKQYGKRNAVVWNSIFRLIGVDIIVDNGSGIIHENEPCAGVVLNPRSIKHVDTIKNITPYQPNNHVSWDGKKSVYTHNTINSKTLNSKKEGNDLYIVKIKYYDRLDNNQQKTMIIKVYSDFADDATKAAINAVDQNATHIYHIETTKK